MSESPIDLMTVVYSIGAFGLLVGTIPAIRLLGGDYRGARAGFLLAIPAVAGISYVSMAFGGGEVAFQGYPVPIERYADWLVTTPLLVGYSAYIAGMNRTWIIGAAVADALMIVFGGVAVALAPPGQWIGFAASALCHLSLLGVLYGVLPTYAREQPSERRRLARILQNHVGLLWLAYPVVWLFGPGLQTISATAVGITITFMDVVAKTPYVYFVYRARNVFVGPSQKQPQRAYAQASPQAPAQVPTQAPSGQAPADGQPRPGADRSRETSSQPEPPRRPAPAQR